MKKPPWHISGRLHVTGSSQFIGDSTPLPGMLHAKFLFSPVAHARLLSLDTSVAAGLSGIAAVITANDIPGENQIGHVIKDEPLFPVDVIKYVGQPLAMVLAEDTLRAEQAVKMIKLKYEELVPILEIDEADARGEWYVPERRIVAGDVDTALSSSPYVLEGWIESPAQEHFYMESQRCDAIPLDDERILLYSATQSTMEVQEVVSHLLALPAHKIIVDVPRLGGAFGGKERSGTIWACFAALGTQVTRRPVRVLLERREDILATGKRHPFKSHYRIGFDDVGRLRALDVELLSNGGAYADLSIAILERAMFHVDNAYHIPVIRIRGRACRTNLPPNTAFRGFGAPQGIYVIERLIELIARQLNKDALEIRKINAYRDGDLAPYGQPVRESRILDLFSRLEQLSDYRALRKQVEGFNHRHHHKKQGIAVTPVKFGISFTTALLNQASALIWIYIDGSVSVTTGSVEMGQEVNTKVAVVVSRILGIPIERIRIESSNTQRVGNASPTAASTGSDINGNAARIAAEKLVKQLSEPAWELINELIKDTIAADDHHPPLPPDRDGLVFADDMVWSAAYPDHKIKFSALIRHAYNQRIALAAYGYYRTPDVWFDRDRGAGHPFHYYVFGCALSQVEVDLMTGEHRILAAYIVHENGQTLHPEIDRGQIIGAYIQCYGWCAVEDIVHDKYGRYMALTPSTYKIPSLRELPDKLVVEMVESKSRFASVMGSKATGEPPFIYGLSVFFAIENAVRDACPDAQLHFPAIPESVVMALDRG